MVIHILLLPISLIGSAIGRVYFQRLTTKNAPADNTAKISLQILRLTTILAIIPALFLLLGGDKLVIMFLGDRWTTVGGVAISLSIWSIPTILTQPMIPVFRAFNLQNELFKYNGLYFLFSVGIVFIGCMAGWNLYLILSSFTLLCTIVKFMMLGGILRSASVSWNQVFKGHIILIYILTLVLWVIRIVHII